jgi:hypothetical protein
MLKPSAATAMMTETSEIASDAEIQLRQDFFFSRVLLPDDFTDFLVMGLLHCL